MVSLLGSLPGEHQARVSPQAIRPVVKLALAVHLGALGTAQGGSRLSAGREQLLEGLSIWQERALRGQRSMEVEIKRVPGWERSGKWDVPTHRAVGSVANCPGDAQGYLENGQTSDIWARDLQGGNQNHMGGFLVFPDPCLLVLQGWGCRISLHMRDTPMPLLGLGQGWGPLPTRGLTPYNPYHLCSDAQVLSALSVLQSIQSPCWWPFHIFLRPSWPN